MLKKREGVFPFREGGFKEEESREHKVWMFSRFFALLWMTLAIIFQTTNTACLPSLVHDAC